ncbi:54S ribosomal protein L3 [Biscogniauxia mediterranea]|nr:54S ribosomal protein L3 [Biscogniauxia mediterranea]
MKRIRIERLSPSQLLATSPARSATACSTRISQAVRASSRLPAPTLQSCRQIRCQSSAALSPDAIYEDGETSETPLDTPPPDPIDYSKMPLPSPHPSRARLSAKLAALHARLALSSKLPVETLARCLVDASADAHPRFNNATLAHAGAALLQYHVSEWLIARYPRLPMSILFAAMKGYAGVPALYKVAHAWGVECAAAPGEEVDPGLLQFVHDRATVSLTRWGFVRSESKEVQRYKWRRGMSSRVIYDDAFGEMVPGQKKVEHDALDVGGSRNTRDLLVDDVKQTAHANFVRALIGAVWLHSGREAAKAFVKAHILSRQLDLSNLFEFKIPTRDLARLCARENFESPVARLLSETGRLSRTPVFVVGIYSGRDKLGEGFGPSLDSARISAAIHALKAWYLYSPGDSVNLPSDALSEDAAPWKPVYVDIGEVIS